MPSTFVSLPGVPTLIASFKDRKKKKKEVGLEQNEKGEEEEEEEEKNFLLFRGNLRKTQPLSIELARCASVYTTTKKRTELLLCCCCRGKG
jgi:hypothetical protein